MSKYSNSGEQITGIVSGWNQFSTHENPAKKEPRPVLTPSDLLFEINKLKDFLNTPEILKAIRMLTEHINDKTNPHEISLLQLTDSVIDALYQRYVELGGKLGKGSFINELFKVLHVASEQEMKDGTDESALISIRGLRSVLHSHNVDPNAHEVLIDKLVPGKPIATVPAYAIHSRIGIADTNLTVHGDVPYTYIDKRRVLCTAEAFKPLPVDYSYNEPLIPCFGSRTNEVVGSNDFTKLLLDNVAVSPIDSIADPSLNNQTTAVVNTSVLSIDRVHSLGIRNYELPINSSYTFSVFVKKGSCRYFMLSYEDVTNESITVRAIVDLTTGATLLQNHMERYTSEVITLANGWYRVTLSAYHPFGQIAPLQMTFFKEKDPSLQNFGFVGEENEVLGYIFGMQREKGNNVSPYIPTVDSTVTRLPVDIDIPVEDEWLYNNGYLSYHAVFRNPGADTANTHRPLLCAVTSENKSSLEIHLGSDKSAVFSTYRTITVGGVSTRVMVLNHVIIGENSKYTNVVYGQDDQGIITSHHGECFTYDHQVIKDSESKLMLGRNPEGEYAEAYFRNLTVYPIRITSDQCVFLNGEIIYD